MPYTAERVRSRHPFEIFFLCVVLVTSISGLASPELRPGSVQEGVGHTGTILWYCTLLLGGLTAMAGIFWRERATGLVAEAVGLAVSGIATLFYGGAALLLASSSIAYAATMLMGYGAAALWRAKQIRATLVTVAKSASLVDRG